MFASSSLSSITQDEQAALELELESLIRDEKYSNVSDQKVRTTIPISTADESSSELLSTIVPIHRVQANSNRTKNNSLEKANLNQENLTPSAPLLC